MPTTVSTTCQARWKDCCKPSSEVGLTLVSNGEEPVGVFTTNYTIVPAGFLPPTVAATMADGGTGLLPAGYVYYLYVYASSQYPGVDATTTAGGFLWPKSQPSPVSAVYLNTVNHQINVTLTKTTRSDVDRILIYRTSFGATNVPLSIQQIEAQAGQVFYVGFVPNDGMAGTVTFTDNVVATQEELEVDNFTAPQFWICEYIDPYWYGIGNPDLEVSVTIDSSGNLTSTPLANVFYAGRNGAPSIPQLVTFDGINKGGFDGQGTFYFQYQSATVANVSVSSDLSTTDFPGYVGTTTMHVRGASGTLYRSKSHNPFAWGYTEFQISGDSQIRVPQSFAKLISGYGVAITTIPEQRLLKVDMERPSRAFAIDVSVPLESNFDQALKLLDTRYIVTSNFTQFPALLSNGQTSLRGFDASNFAIVQGDSGGQAPVSSEVFETLRTAVTSGDIARLFHGVFDPLTELSATWIKTGIEQGGGNTVPIDLCVLYHGPSGQWSVLRDLGITASASIYDPVTLETITLVGTMDGVIGRAFARDTSTGGQFIGDNFSAAFGTITYVGATNYFSIIFTGNVGNGQYIDVTPGGALTGLDRFYFWVSGAGPDTPPSTPSGGRLFRVKTFAAPPTLAASSLQAAMVATGSYNAIAPIGSDGTENSVLAAGIPGNIPTCDAGTAPAIVTYQTTDANTWSDFSASNAQGFTSGSSLIGCWALFYDVTYGIREVWGHVSQFTASSLYFDLWFDPATLMVTTTPPGGYAVSGDSYSVGLINCEGQTYFQPSATNPSTQEEMWATLLNVNTPGLWARIYQEFDSAYYQTPFRLTQDIRQSGTPSNNWTTKTQIPTTLVNQFGARFIERGYGDFTMLGYTIMGKQS